MTNSFDVIVIGGGGAGLNISQLLAKQRLSVAVFDRKADLLNIPFYTLGSFIDLAKHGLSKKVVAANVTELVFHSKHVRYKKHGTAYILNKYEVHKELLQKAHKNGVVIFSGISITKVQFNKDKSIAGVSDAKGQTYRAKVYVDATGAAGFVSKQIGLQNKQTAIATGVEYNVLYKAPQQLTSIPNANNFISQGTKPVADNFDLFTLAPDGLTIIFNPAQVAPDFAGTRTVTIPYSQLNGLWNPQYGQ